MHMFNVPVQIIILFILCFQIAKIRSGENFIIHTML